MGWQNCKLRWPSRDIYETDQIDQKQIVINIFTHFTNDALENFKKLHFNGLILFKVYNA